MKASIVDLRYRMNDVLKALDRNETVTIMYHGDKKGTIVPYQANQPVDQVQQTALFGMYKDDKESVDDVMEKLRGNRYRDI